MLYGKMYSEFVDTVCAKKCIAMQCYLYTSLNKVCVYVCCK